MGKTARSRKKKNLPNSKQFAFKAARLFLVTNNISNFIIFIIFMITLLIMLAKNYIIAIHAFKKLQK